MNSYLLVGSLLTLTLLGPPCAEAQRRVLGPESSYISGRVLLTIDRRPVQGVPVKLTLLTGGFQTMVTTDGNGDFQFPGLPSGMYVVVVEAVGYGSIQETVQLGTGGVPELTLWLKKNDAPPSGQTGYLISVRELSVPSKARKEFQKGLQSRAGNDLAGSLRHFRRAVEDFPSYYEAYLQIGFDYRQSGQQAEAEQAIRKSIELSGDGYAAADFTLGEILAEKKQYSGAEQVARQGLFLKPASWTGQYLLAWVLFAQDRFKEAEESARKALALKRDFARVHLLLASIHMRTRDDAALLNDLNAYLTLDPEGSMNLQARQLREKVQRDLASEQQDLPAVVRTP